MCFCVITIAKNIHTGRYSDDETDGKKVCADKKGEQQQSVLKRPLWPIRTPIKQFNILLMNEV